MRLRYALATAAVMLLLGASTALATTGFFASCNGLQEVPANASPGTGSAVVVLDNAQTQITYSVSFSGLLAGLTASHIHGPAAVGFNASVLVGFNITGASGLTSGSFGGTAPVTATIVNHMLAGNTYVNLHTSLFTGGEIRGQLYMDATPSGRTTWGEIKSLYR